MRTTVRVDDDLMQELKDLAHKEGTSLAKLFNRTVRLGLDSLKCNGSKTPKPYREKTFRMGKPMVDLTKAIHVLNALDDDVFIERFNREK